MISRLISAHKGSMIDMPLSQLVGRGLVIDISHLPENGLATQALIQEWEVNNTAIQPNDIAFSIPDKKSTGH
nr:cyclase family protein [Zophobihabitans entericus]